MEWMDTPEADMTPRSEGRLIAAQKAYEDWEKHYKGELLNLVTDHANQPSICRTGSQGYSGSRENGHDSRKLFGTSDLITETLNCLDGERFRSIWMVAQRQRADYLLEASLDHCIDYFWKTRKYYDIPMPGVAAITLSVEFAKIRSMLSKIWRIKTEPADLIETESLAIEFACFGRDLSLTWLTYTVLGPLMPILAGTDIEATVLILIVTCSIFFERIFWAQQEAGEDYKALSTAEFRREAKDFGKSQERVFCNDFITKALARKKSKEVMREIGQTVFEISKVGDEDRAGKQWRSEDKAEIINKSMQNMESQYRTPKRICQRKRDNTIYSI